MSNLKKISLSEDKRGLDNLTKEEKEEYFEKVEGIVVSGVSHSKRVQQVINLRIPSVNTHQKAIDLINKVISDMSISVDNSLEYNINLHAERYSNVFAEESRLLDKNAFEAKDAKAVAKKIELAKEALVRKESLYTIGRNDKDNIERVTQIILNKKKEESKKDIHVSDEEAYSIYKILKKARVNEANGVHPVNIVAGEKGEDLPEDMNIENLNAKSENASIQQNNFNSIKSIVKPEQKEQKQISGNEEALLKFFKSKGKKL